MRKLLLLFAALNLLLAGCCCTKTCREGGRDMCYIENSGWKLFGHVPIASGDPIHPNEDKVVWFEDTVTLDVNVNLLGRVMREGGYTGLYDLTSYRTEEIIIPFLFKRYIYHTSAELLK